MLAAEHWYTSAALQGGITTILGLLTLIAAVVALWFQWFASSRRRLSYEIRTAIPLIQAPAEVSRDLKVVYDGTAIKDPYFIELRLVNTSRKDISSIDFDQEMPIRFEFGIDIVRLLKIALEPDEPRVLNVKMDGSAVEIGPGLLHGHQALSITLLADGPDISIRYSKPLAGVGLGKLVREDSATLGRTKLSTILGWLLIAFLVWWVISSPNNAAHLVHNIGAFFSSI